MLALRRWSVAVVATAGLLAVPSAHAASAPATVVAPPVAKALTAKGLRATVTVRNTSKRRLTGLRLSAGKAKGVRVTLKGAKRGVRTIGTLRPRRSARIAVTLRRAKGGPAAGRVTLRLRRGTRTIATGRLTFGPTQTTPSPKPGPSPAPAPAAETLTGRYYWGSQYSLNGTLQKTLLFVSPNLVFTGDAEGAYPTCTAVTEDCRPYAFDPATRALVIDGQPATLAGNGLTFDGQSYALLGAGTPGARWDVVLTYANSSGLCPTYCNYFREDLAFRPDGTFIRGAVVSGTGPGADYGIVPDDQKGLYEIRADGTLRLAFADGKERVETLGIYPDAAGAYPANPTAGVVLNGDGYFDIRD